MAVGVGFEPTGLSPNGFQDRRLKPLGHPTERRVSYYLQLDEARENLWNAVETRETCQTKKPRTTGAGVSQISFSECA